MADIRGNSQRNSPRGSNSNSNSNNHHNNNNVYSSSNTMSAGFNINSHDYDVLLKGSSSTSLAGITDGRDYVIGGGGGGSSSSYGGSGSSYGVAGGSSGAGRDGIMASTSTAHHHSGGMTNQMDMRNTGARGGIAPIMAAPPLGLAGPSGSSHGSSSAMSSAAAHDLHVRKGAMSGVPEHKVRRFLEYNQRLREQLEMPRIPVSEASRR